MKMKIVTRSVVKIDLQAMSIVICSVFARCLGEGSPVGLRLAREAGESGPRGPGGAPPPPTLYLGVGTRAAAFSLGDYYPVSSE